MQGNNAKYWVDALAYALDALITVAVLLRLIARRRSKATFAVDDVFIILSVFPFYGMTVLGHISRRSIDSDVEHGLINMCKWAIKQDWECLSRR